MSNQENTAFELFPIYDFDSYDGEEDLSEEKIYSASDALIKSISKYGKVNLNFMSELSHCSAEKLVSELSGAIFQTPETFINENQWSIDKGWILKSQYLIGNIPRKIEIAKMMNRKFEGKFDNNIEALEKIKPEKLCFDEINVSLGATWIQPRLYSRFVDELLQLHYPSTVIYNKELSSWKVDINKEDKKSVLNSITYGTYNMGADKIIEQTMNAKVITVCDYIWSGGNFGCYKPIINQAETLVAQEKQKLIIRTFLKWIESNKHIKALIQEYYNDTYVGYATSQFDGKFLELPDLSERVTLYDHQRDAVARIVLSNDNVLLAHDVGTGKTYEMICGAHELHRLGISKKNLIVVPNNILKAFVDTHKMLYENDKILAVFPNDFSPEYRNDVLKRIKTEEFTAIYMAYSSFDMITMSKGYYVDKMESCITKLKAACENTNQKKEKSAIASKIKRLNKKLTDYIFNESESEWISFDELGIETLFLDEAHNYKNIKIDSGNHVGNVVGMHGAGSKKSNEMLEKCHYTNRLVFATGTPLTNSLADLYVLQTYLQPEELKYHKIDSFGMWLNTFGERETTYEINVDSTQIKPVTRFSSFHNLTELMSIFSLVCDFHHTEIDAQLPEFKGYLDVCVPKNELQKEYIKNISKRCEDIHEHRVGRSEDNFLKVTVDGRKCALDIRLVEACDSGLQNTKIDACQSKVIEIYNRFPGCCQLVFSDIGTPKATFNVYDCLKNKLIRNGIPREEIAYIHDATTEKARTNLFNKINAGVIRVIIGSTSKLGVGVNVQEKLVAIHHLSVPWKPSDMVQREGRIIRRGNTCKEVFVYRYITEGSFDSYSWQLLENKQRFIASFLSGTSTSRTVEDIADSVLSYAEIKALAIGNPLIKQRVETANKIEHQKIAARTRQKQLNSLREVVSSATGKLKNLEDEHHILCKDFELYSKHKAIIHNSERISFGEELLDALRDNKMKLKERVFDNYQGFNVVLPKDMSSDKPFIYITSENGGRYYVNMDTDRPIGCSMRIDRFLESIHNQAEFNLTMRKSIEKNRDDAKADLQTGNQYYSKIEELEKELLAIDKKLDCKGG